MEFPRLDLPRLDLPNAPEMPVPTLELPSADIPRYQPLVVPPSDLRAPPGVKGTVVEIRVFSRRGIEKDERAISIENSQIEVISRDREDELNILQKSFGNHLKELLIGKQFISGLSQIEKNSKLSFEQLDTLNVDDLIKINIDDDKTIWEREPMEKLANDDQLRAFKHKGFWSPMDTLREKNQLEELWQSAKPPWKNW